MLRLIRELADGAWSWSQPTQMLPMADRVVELTPDLAENKSAT